MNKLRNISLLISKSIILIGFLLIAGISFGQDDAVMKFEGKIKDENGGGRKRERDGSERSLSRDQNKHCNSLPNKTTTQNHHVG